MAWRAKKELREPGITEARTFRSMAVVPADLNEVFPPTQSGAAPLYVRLTVDERSGVS